MEELFHDQGANFTSALLREVISLSGNVLHPTTARLEARWRDSLKNVVEMRKRLNEMVAAQDVTQLPQERVLLVRYSDT